MVIYVILYIRYHLYEIGDKYLFLQVPQTEISINPIINTPSARILACVTDTSYT